jgi:VanZ family protein
MKINLNKKILSSWMWVVSYSVVIFLTVPVARNIQTVVAKYLGKSAFIYLVLAVVGLAFLYLFYFLIVRLKIRSSSNFIWLFVLVGLYFYFTLKLKNSPPEAIHFLEYGLLGFFLFRALKHHIKDSSIYFTATFFCLLIGTFDEILQWITPRRFWDFQDVGLNTLSGGLFLLTIWKVLRPKKIIEKINLKSIRILTSVSIVCILVLGLCASNTPKRVAHYTSFIPSLSFLQEEEPMSEFGDIYKDSEIGAFYSRLTLDSLMEIDEKNSQSYAQILNRPENMEYEQFLKRYNPIVNPFLYELRVHTYRRDKYYKQARSFSDLKNKKESYFIAYKENLILEKYYGNTIKKSIYAWEEDKIKETEALIDKSKPYKSPVSANLFTPFSEKTMWIIIIVLIILLIFVNLTLSFKKKRHKILKE